MDLRDKVALVTGAAGGLGAATARALAARGAVVVASDLDEAAGTALARELGGHFVAADVSDLDANRAAVAFAVDTCGGLDLVHLNAGVSTGCGVGEDFDLALYRRANGANLDGVVFDVAYTPGHTPGHHGLLVRLAKTGPVLLTGDLAHFAENYAENGVPMFNVDRANTLASFDRFKRLAASLKAMVIIQHEQADVKKLPVFPVAAE